MNNIINLLRINKKLIIIKLLLIKKLIIIHLGKNPKNGGKPPSERKLIMIENLIKKL